MGTTNVLLTTVGGLGLPSTLCLQLPEEFSVLNLQRVIDSLTPAGSSQCDTFLLHNGRVLQQETTTLRDLLQQSSHARDYSSFLQICMSARLRGGKGGFGSQLRAAGGRMSSRKRKQNAELATGSARNLDGRRLRTITEAKNLATYLATKPDMDQKEKEEKRKRWEFVVELAEQREADMKAGKTADGRRKGLSSEWLEEKEQVGEDVKNAVKLAMSAHQDEPKKEGNSGDSESTQESADEDSDIEDPMELDEDDMARLRTEAEAGDADARWVLQNKLKIPANLIPKPKPKPTRLAGFDDDLSDTDSDFDGDAPQQAEPSPKTTAKT